MILSLDVETKSAVELKRAGAHRYAADQTTDLWCACFAFGDEPVETWFPGQPCPARIVDHVFEGGTISAWNANFERLIWNGILAPRYGWPQPTLEQFEDTAAAGAAMGLPRNLGDACKAMGTAFQKDDEGHRLMLRMAKPRRPRKGEEPEGLLWWDDEDRLARLAAYCARDVEAERALRAVLVPLGPDERETWLFDARMNDRGVLLDLDLVRALRAVADQAKALLDARMAEATGGAVTACTQVARLTAWLREQGVAAESLAKAAIEELLLDAFMPEAARSAIEIRREAAKSSTAKLDAMLACVSADGRARGQHLYHGAGTGRWSGRLIQVQNFPRGTGTVKNPAAAVEDFLHASAPWIEIMHGSPMSAVSDMLRSCLTAGPGKRLLAADFSAIEGRVTAWVAQEVWKLAAFRANDEGRGAGIYELTASGILSKLVGAITKAERQAYGKVPELALGFQGGVMAFDSMAKIYRVDMAEAYGPLLASTGEETWSRAEDRYEECLERQDTGTDTMTREAWIASEVTKVLWRQKHPATVALWRGLEKAAFDATVRPGTVFKYGCISYVVKRGFLWCRLPSGRCLAYGAPKIQTRETPWGQRKAVVTALGVDSVTKRWVRFALYGGLATENCLSGDTEVLTDRGWLAIHMVETALRVWDGQEWVRHDGLLYQGWQETIDFGGVRMTPDHKVWTADGWKLACEASYEQAASQGTEPPRPRLRPVDGDRLCGIRRAEVVLASALRLRGGEAGEWLAPSQGEHAQLRVSPSGEPRPITKDAWDDLSPGLLGLAQHERSLPPADTPGVSQLWRSGHLRLRPLAAQLRRLLGGYGAVLRVWFDDRKTGQRRKLRAGQLCLGDSPASVAQHAHQPSDRHTERADAALRRRGANRHWRDDAALSLEGGLARVEDVRPARRGEPRLEPVYDLLNAGPRRRFTVRGSDGRPFIVSNCVQAIARDCMRDGMLACERAGYPIVLTVHDEAVAEVDEGFGSLAEFERLLAEMQPWADGLPVVATGYEAHRFKKD